MKKGIKKISRCMLWIFVCLTLVTIKGCGDNQSNEVIYVSGFKVLLFRNPDEPDSQALDRWAVSQDQEGKDICGLAHGYFLQLTDENNKAYHEAGIRCDIEVVDHGSIAGFGDIWDKEAPNGEKYGFLKCLPEEGSGMYDGVLHGRTDGQGRLWIFAGLGDPEGTFDPDAPLDYDYELPGPGGGYNDVFDTWVELKITVPRRHLPMQPVYVWATFNRMQYQNMWEPHGGVYGNSNSGLGELGGYSMSIQTQSLNDGIAIEPPNVKRTPKSKASDYPLDTKIQTGKTLTTIASSSGPSLGWAHWYQLRWDPYLPGWYWDDPLKMHALWVNDANDPNDMIDAVTTCEPYALWMDITLPEPFDGNDCYSTVHLRAIQDSNVVSKIPMGIYFASKSPDNKTLTMFSDYVVIVENPEDQGYYYDIWNNLYVAIYALQGCILDADFPEPFGDFNADDVTDWRDLSLFSWHWLDSASDVNTTFDAMYEEPNHWDGSINFRDFSAFAENWLVDVNE